MTDRIPAEVSPPGQFIQDEMDARGWSDVDVAVRMGGVGWEARAYDLLGLQLILAVHGRNGPDAAGLILGEPMIAGLARAFDVDPQFFRNLEQVWFNHPTTVAMRERPRGKLP